MTKTAFTRCNSRFGLNLKYQVTMAINRLLSLTNMLHENPTGESEYMAFTNDLIKNGDAEPVSKNQVHSTYHNYYIPHKSLFSSFYC